MAHKILSPEALAVLADCTTSENILKLPDRQLERKLYTDLKAAFENAGGKWKGGKTMGFVFSGPAEGILALLSTTGRSEDVRKTRQAYFTPTATALLVAHIAGVKNYEVLEPSAGQGALADACISSGASSVCCIELDPGDAESLRTRYPSAIEGDFLTIKPAFLAKAYGRHRFKRIVMNPPFTKGQDVKHVIHAMQFLEPGGILTVILPDTEHPELLHLKPKFIAALTSGTFKESGTMIATAIYQITA